MTQSAGQVRIIGIAPSGLPIATTPDLRIEVCQADGSWIPLRGVCSIDIRIRRDEIITAAMDIELAWVELINPMVIIRPSSLLERARWWWRVTRVRWQQRRAWTRKASHVEHEGVQAAPHSARDRSADGWAPAWWLRNVDRHIDGRGDADEGKPCALHREPLAAD